MARRHEPIAPWTAAVFVLAALGVGLGPLLAEGASLADLNDGYLWRVLRFTGVQAALSTAISIALAVPVALALARHDFPAKAFALRLLALPLALPPVIAILGLIAVFGAEGWFGGHIGIYGLTGILIAHAFFNMPLAARLLVERLQAVPPETVRLAAALGFSGKDRFRLIEWPLIRAALPGVAALIFLLCAASFSVVLILGGGPQATTLEVAIYQSLRLDYDPARAAALALAQLALCVSLVAILSRYANPAELWPRMRLAAKPASKPGPAASLILAVAFLILLAPFAALAWEGLRAPWAIAAWGPALAKSLVIAFAAAALSLGLAFALAGGAARSRRRAIFGFGGFIALIVPPAVLATGWFIVSVRLGVQRDAGPPLVVLLNALMALPFALGALAPAVIDSARRNDRLCAGLGLSGWRRFRLIDFAELKRPLLFAAAVSLVVSLGDLTAVTLFGTEELVTLPSLIHSQMGGYRLNEAFGTALLLLAVSLGLLTLADRQAPA